MREKITSETNLRFVATVQWPDGEIGGIVQTGDNGTRALINRRSSRDWFTLAQLIKTNARVAEINRRGDLY
jgi:hypothetical protein